MFYSALYTKISSDLKSDVFCRHKEIVELFYDLWLDVGDDVLEPLFPPGFIDRDKKRAERIIRDLWTIVNSPIPRDDPGAIYCYVMYQMIELWFDDEYTQSTDLLPQSAKEYLLQHASDEQYAPDEEDEYTDSDMVRDWFTDKDTCQGDLEDSYDENYVDETIAEAAAEIFLSEGKVPDCLGIDIQELVDLLPNDLYWKVMRRFEEDRRKAEQYAQDIWPQIENYFHVVIHADPSTVTSFQGAKYILDIFKDWVENNGGWKIVQHATQTFGEVAVHKLIFLGAKTYLQDHNLDINCETNVGVGQEDVKISRGNDKTVIEVKLSSNPRCKHGFEKQLLRYAEAEHTDNMIYCLVDLGNAGVVDQIKELQIVGKEKGQQVPEVFVVNASQQKSASVL